MKRRWIAICCGLILLAGCWEDLMADTIKVNSLEYAQSPADNPLKGFVSWEDQETDFPHSLEYYGIPLKTVQINYDEYNWKKLERILERVKKRGNQAVLRFYIDYPGKKSGIPEFLLKDGVKLYSYKDESGKTQTCADYADPRLVQSLVNFIQEFGKKYDGDPRIADIQAGLLGFYGEWHTYPYTQWYPSSEVYALIGRTYEESFQKTHVLVGEINQAIKDMGLGYHDDMFAVDTAYKFYRDMEKFEVTDKWKQYPIGGELTPSIIQDYFKKEPIEGAMKWEEALDLAHPSWILNSAISDYRGKEREEAINSAKLLGYDFTVSQAYYRIDKIHNKMTIGIDIENKGIAPFYYDWEIELGIQDSLGNVVDTYSTDWKLSSIMPYEGVQHLEYTVPAIPKEIQYTLMMRVINPMTGGKNLYFSNVEQREDGWLYLFENITDFEGFYEVVKSTIGKLFLLF